MAYIRRPTNPEPRDRRFTQQELDKIFKCNRTNPHMKFIISFALETGMRRSEIANIKPEHVKGNLLTIPVGKTKPRKIPLTPKAVQLLQNNLPINEFKCYTSKLGKVDKRTLNRRCSFL